MISLFTLDLEYTLPNRDSNNCHPGKKAEKVFSFLRNQNSTSNRILLFLKVALLTTVLSMGTTGCSYTGSGDTINQGNAEPDTHLSSPVPSFDVTPVDTEDFENPAATPPGIQPFFYVSKEGNNTDGRSWDTAWNELDQIQWEELQPGDTIVIAGGEYHTQLDVKKSGTPGLPITFTSLQNIITSFITNIIF